MFDGAFVLCILHAILTTEWYLAGESGLLEEPGTTLVSPFRGGKSVPNTATVRMDTIHPESRPLIQP